MIPHMNGDLLELIKSILRMFIKSAAIEASFNLTKIDLHNIEIRLKLSQIDIGFAADESLSNSRKKDIISLGDIKEFKMQCMKDLISAVEILPNSFPQSTHEANRNEMKNLLRHIISLGILTPSFSDKAFNQFSKFLTTECTTNRDIFIGYDRSNKHLDDFYFKDINITKYPDLASVKLVLALSHGQASVKKEFSVNKAIITNNISTDCWKAPCVRHYKLTNSLKAHNLQITSNLRVVFKFARQKYQFALEAERSKKENQAVEDQKAIEDVKSQITLLTKTSATFCPTCFEKKK